jgi:hypothetical protein
MSGAEWFYTQNGQRQGPVSLEALAAMKSSGQLQPQDLVWTGGMSDWKPSSQVSELSAQGTPSPIEYASPGMLQYSSRQMEALMFTPRAMDMLRQTRPWVRLVSILMFIGAALAILGVLSMLAVSFAATRGSFGAPMVMLILYTPFALLYIIPAVYLSRYAARINDLQKLNRADVLEKALEAQKSFWKFVGILIVVMIALWGLIFLSAVGFGVMFR